MKAKNKPMKITLWLIRETDKARLYSKVRPDRHPTKEDEHTVTLPDWFIEKEGL